MVEHTVAATNAIVTLDVPIPEVIWGWMITLNMWAKSIGTGVVFIGAYLLARYNDKVGEEVKFWMPLISFIFLNIFLLFTLLDLHQPLRMWHIFAYPHFTSAITVGAWMATVFTGIIFIMMLIALKNFAKKHEDKMPRFVRELTKKCEVLSDSLYSPLLKAAVVLAVPVTMYTATIMGEATARELWQTPTELVQMMLAALLTGSAVFLIIGGKWGYEIKRDLAIILGVSAFLSFTIYMGEYYFGHMKAEEVAAILAYVKEHGAYHAMFWAGQWLAFIIPMILVYFSLKSRSASLLYLASVSAIVGLYITKHVWLIIPQLLPLS
ncbi:NrfD/PsrC family molybdoenzyme membrane anchor subunit [Nitratiruptor tergarcus]|uniref:Formate-dependent nitrite reductase, membrane component NrfD n=1 Tax=Nitratiruptor tergarcus DSM 16512 TaxID=1069081 RepID=A0A1W1WT70_9BACT|nr:NrfD/PsrC family molybdoenzyme membrane anchor subunit [Nitratiruptor tergarcus]SMC09250.1 Formate-dependent nitrite reductase, membrane component NrfD [Nitratiruptor tergarcus DSM 16512]